MSTGLRIVLATLAWLTLSGTLIAQEHRYVPVGQERASSSGQVSSGEVEDEYTTVRELPLFENSFEFNIVFFSSLYELDVDDPAEVEEDGGFGGVRFAYEYEGLRVPLYSRINIDFLGGEADIEGRNSSGTRFTDTSDNFFFNLETMLGVTLGGENSFVDLTFYVGLGVRLWVHEIDDLEEDYVWGIAPVGVRLKLKLTPYICLVGNLSARFQFGGDITLNLSDDPDVDDPRADLEDEVGFRLEVSLRIRLDEHWTFVLSPWVEYFPIGESEDFDNIVAVSSGGGVSNIFKPASETTFAGINIGFRFSF